MFLLAILLIFKISEISIDENKIVVETSLELNKDSINEGTYLLKGDISFQNKIIGNISRFSRIYFPCKKSACNYPFKIEMKTEKINKNNFVGFIENKGIELNLILNEIKGKEERIIKLPFNYSIDLNSFTNLNIDLIKINNINVNLKEKPSIKFNLNITNPFDFKLFISEANIIFRIENQNVQNNFQINEEIGKGEKSFSMEVPLKGNLLFYILSRKFMEEDISTKISASYNGTIIIKIENYFIEIPFEK